MVFLALKNLRLRKLRTAISILAVGVGIMTMVVLRGLTEGSIGEVASRMSSIQADLLVWDRSHHTMMHNQTMSAKYADKVGEIDGVARVVPVLNDSVRLGGQPQTIYSVPVDDFDIFGGQESLVAGKVFAPGAKEMVIDEVLAAAHKGGLTVGQTITYRDEPFKIVGIAKEGVVGRVFMSYETATAMLHNGKRRANMLVVKVARPGQVEAVSQAIRKMGLIVVDKGNYYSVIEKDFKYLTVFVISTMIVTLLVSFLTILLTVFTIVQEQTREIGILRSMGATRGAIMRLVISQSLIICSAGVVVGFAMSLAARYAIGHVFPLMTMSMGPLLLATAVGVGIFGGLLGALYPALRAAWLDPVESLSYE
jgi:putative ABC transport system permease protein